MTNQDPSWYMTRRKLNSKKDGLERAALSSLRQGNPDEARRYAQEADSLEFCKSSSTRKPENTYRSNTERPRRHKTHPQIGGVVPVKVVRRRRRKVRRPSYIKPEKEKN